jgi:sec-independent protein translocase protein TatC
MPLTEHLRELRSRLLRSVLAVVAGAVVAFLVWPQLLEILTIPLCEVRADRGVEECGLVFFGPFDALLLRLRMSLVVGVVLAAPVWLYQLWRFVTPGLYRNERRWALSFTFAASVLFAMGVLVAFYTLQAGLRLLLAAGGDAVVPLLEVNRYLGYVTTMIVVFGVSFLLPLFVIVLNLAGVLTYRSAARWRRLTWFVLVVFAAFATPSQDPVTMMLLAGPMVVLYEAALLFARVHDRRQARRARKEGGGDADAGDLPDDLPSTVAPGAPLPRVEPAEPTAETDLLDQSQRAESPSRSPSPGDGLPQ